jgi:hypothetical protein
MALNHGWWGPSNRNLKRGTLKKPPFFVDLLYMGVENVFGCGWIVYVDDKD